MELKVYEVDELLKARRQMQITPSEAAKKAWETRKYGGSHKAELPAKGQVLKERGEVKETEKVTKVDISTCKKNIKQYFGLQKEVRDLQGQLENKKAQMEGQMKSIRPYLAKMQNQEKEENKFRAKFEDEEFMYNFLQSTLSKVAYKEVLEFVLPKLSAELRDQVSAVRKKMTSVYSTEKFERKEITKSATIADHLKRIVALKEQGLELFRKLLADKIQKGVFLKLPPQVLEAYNRGQRFVIMSPMAYESLSKDEREEDDMETDILTLDEALLEKSKGKQTFQVDGKISKELLTQITEDKDKIKAHYRGDFVVKEPGVPDHKGRPSAIIEMTSGKWKGGTFEIFLNGIE